jgi:hypothetical protein
VSRLSAYKAIKQMLLNGRLHPTIVSIIPDSAPATTRASAELCKNLQECAMTFMGHELDTVMLHMEYPQGRVQAGGMHTFALRMLERATPLQRHPFANTTLSSVDGAQKRMGAH